MTASRKILNLLTFLLIGALLGCTLLSTVIRNHTQPEVETVSPTEQYLEEEGIRLLYLPAAAMRSEPIEQMDESDVLRNGEQWYVYVVRSSIGLFGSVYHAEKVSVSLYLQDGDTVAVTSQRLSRHDEVIVSPPEQISDGSPVRMAETEN